MYILSCELSSRLALPDWTANTASLGLIPGGVDGKVGLPNAWDVEVKVGGTDFSNGGATLVIRSARRKMTRAQPVSTISSPAPRLSLIEMACIGEVEITLCFRPGVADIHEKSFSRDANLKRTWEEYMALRGSDLRMNAGHKANEKY